MVDRNGCRNIYAAFERIPLLHSGKGRPNCGEKRAIRIVMQEPAGRGGYCGAFNRCRRTVLQRKTQFWPIFAAQMLPILSRRKELLIYLKNRAARRRAPSTTLTKLNEPMCWELLNAFLVAFICVVSLRAERELNQSPSKYQLPAILPQQLIEMRPEQFYEVVKLQHERLLEFLPLAYIVKIDEEFRHFKRFVNNSSTLKCQMSEF